MPAAHLASPARGRARLIRAAAVPAALALLTACGASSGGSAGSSPAGWIPMAARQSTRSTRDAHRYRRRR